jgi:glycosyltransferase involved in cell wall biosynthesis
MLSALNGPKLRILCLDQFSELGGGQMSLLDLIPGLLERGWDPVVALPGEGSFSKRVRQLDCAVEVFNAPEYPNGKKRTIDMFRYATTAPGLTQRIIRLVSDRNPQVLYVNAARMLPIASFVARSRSIPLVFHCHNRVTQPAALAFLGASLKLGRAFVISCCNYSAEPLRPYLREGAVSVIYNGVADTRRTRLSSHAKPYRIGVVGRVEPEKGQMEFVAAARLVLQTLPSCSFVVVGAPLFSGNGYLQRVLEASRGLPIEFTGWKTDVPSVLSTLDLLVVPSPSIDAAPRIILEAFAAGVPVVAFPSGGIPEIIHDGHNGFLAAQCTPEALAERIKFIFRLEPARRHAVVLNARNCWRDRHSLDNFRREVCNRLANALASKSPTRGWD